MERRYPSIALNSTAIRRRSGVLSSYSNPVSPTILHSPNTYHPREEDEACSMPLSPNPTQPTIVLIPPAFTSPETPDLPLSCCSSPEQPPIHSIQEAGGRENDPELASVKTSISQILRLPSPEFTAAGGGRRSFLPRGLSFLSFRGISRPSFIPSLRPSSIRTDSSMTSTSRNSTSSRSSCTSIDSGHLLLIPSVGTTEKFTHKWPRPQSLHEPGTEKGLSGAYSALEEGAGLGMDRLERWGLHKWFLLLSISTVFSYGAAGLACAMISLTAWEQADVLYVADGDILIFITLASSILLLASLVGVTGAFLNSRPILAIYTLLLWPALVSMLSVGYVSYKRYTFALNQKLDLAWSQYYTSFGRLLIQNSLKCCGYYNALHEAEHSSRCYVRTSLPGCKGKLLRFERVN